MAPLFAALGRFAYRRRRAIVALWLLAFVPALVATTHLPGRLKGGGYTRDDSPAKRAEDLQRERLTLGTSTVTLVFSSDDLPATGTRFQALQERALGRVSPETLPGLARVDTATSTGWSDLVSDDGHASLALLEFDLSLDATQELLPKLRELIAPTELDVAVTGDAAVYADVERISARDLRVAESYALPIAVIVLFFVFGSLVAASLPVLGGGISVTVTLGIVYLIAGVTDLSIFVMNVATLIGLAVGIDYSLLMVGRFRQELAAGRDVAGAVEATTDRAGRAIFFSGLAVVVGFLGLFIVGTLPLVSIALGGALVVFVSVAVAMTLLPALLGIIGPARRGRATLAAASRRGSLLASLVGRGHGPRRDRRSLLHGPGPGHRRAGPGDGARRAERRVSAGDGRVAARLRGAVRPFRRRRGRADRRDPHVGNRRRRRRPVHAREPRACLGVRGAACGAPRCGQGAQRGDGARRDLSGGDRQAVARASFRRERPERRRSAPTPTPAATPFPEPAS